MTSSLPILLDEVSARLPLFDDLPEGAVERLSASGLGRGLLTASLRARLRRAGFVDMGVLALATPADLIRVRKIGPVRVRTIRAHLLDELARLYPGARMAHSEDATARRRMDRLRAVPAELPVLDAAALTRLLAPEQLRIRPASTPYDEDAAREARTQQERAEVQREQDREWEEAAPANFARPTAKSRVKR